MEIFSQMKNLRTLKLLDVYEPAQDSPTDSSLPDLKLSPSPYFRIRRRSIDSLNILK